MDMDRAYITKTQQLYHKKSPPMESTRTKEKRQVQEHMEKSGAGDKRGTHHMGRNRDNSSRPRTTEATRWWPMLYYRSNEGVSQMIPIRHWGSWSAFIEFSLISKAVQLQCNVNRTHSERRRLWCDRSCVSWRPLLVIAWSCWCIFAKRCQFNGIFFNRLRWSLAWDLGLACKSILLSLKGIAVRYEDHIWHVARPAKF